jgi:hypothetical protein
MRGYSVKNFFVRAAMIAIVTVTTQGLALDDVDLSLRPEHRVTCFPVEDYCAPALGSVGGLSAAAIATSFAAGKIPAALCCVPVVVGIKVGVFVLAGLGGGFFCYGVGLALRDCIVGCKQGCTRNIHGNSERVV